MILMGLYVGQILTPSSNNIHNITSISFLKFPLSLFNNYVLALRKAYNYLNTLLWSPT